MDFSLQGYQLHMTNMTSIIKNHEKLRKAFLKAVKIVLDIWNLTLKEFLKN